MQVLKCFLLLYVLGLSGFVALLMASDKSRASMALEIEIIAIALNFVLIRTAPDYGQHLAARNPAHQSYWATLRSYTHIHPVLGRIAQALLIISVVSISAAHFL